MHSVQTIKFGKGLTTGTKIECRDGRRFAGRPAGSTMTAALKVVCWSAPSLEAAAAQARDVHYPATRP